MFTAGPLARFWSKVVPIVEVASVASGLISHVMRKDKHLLQKSKASIDCRASQTGDAGWARVRYCVQFLFFFAAVRCLCISCLVNMIVVPFECVARARARPRDLISNV